MPFIVSAVTNFDEQVADGVQDRSLSLLATGGSDASRCPAEAST
jgi:hypothetical protein